jgi:hypothetical protein
MTEGAKKDTKQLDTRPGAGSNLAAAAHDGAKKNSSPLTMPKGYSGGK